MSTAFYAVTLEHDHAPLRTSERSTPVELAAHQRLSKAGIASVFAHDTIRVRRSRHVRGAETRIIPRLPGYAIVQNDGSAAFWRALADLRWPKSLSRIVKGVVAMDGIPIAIPAREIERITDHASAGRRRLMTGDRVRIVVGPFADDNHREILETVGIDRVVVMMSALGKVNLHVDQVEAVAFPH